MKLMTVPKDLPEVAGRVIGVEKVDDINLWILISRRLYDPQEAFYHVTDEVRDPCDGFCGVR